jgi:hypothetical protein
VGTVRVMKNQHARLMKKARALSDEPSDLSFDAFMTPVERGLPSLLSAMVGSVTAVVILCVGDVLLGLGVAALAWGAPAAAMALWRRRERRAPPVTSTVKRLSVRVASALEALDALPPGLEREVLCEAAANTLEELISTGPLLFEAAAHEPHLAEARHSALEDVITELEAAVRSLEAAAKQSHQVLVLEQDLVAADVRIARLKEVASAARGGSDALEEATSTALTEVMAVSTRVRASSPRRSDDLLA